VTHLGWNSQFCGEISFSVRAAAGDFYRKCDELALRLACSGIFHEGYKSAHQPAASRCVKWPFFFTTRRMEFVEMWKYALFLRGCSGSIKN
jgi:hypothetical protein